MSKISNQLAISLCRRLRLRGEITLRRRFPSSTDTISHPKQSPLIGPFHDSCVSLQSGKRKGSLPTFTPAVNHHSSSDYFFITPQVYFFFLSLLYLLMLRLSAVLSQTMESLPQSHPHATPLTELFLMFKLEHCVPLLSFSQQLLQRSG